MPRYIDADKLIAHLKDEIDGCKPPLGGRANGKSIAYGTILGLKSAISFAETLSTADVVPKSEVVSLLDKLMKDLQKRQKYCDKEAEKCGWYLERRGEFDGESAGLDYCLEKIAELKKKYTEEQV